MSIQSRILTMVMRYQMYDFYKDLSIEKQRAKMMRYAKVISLPRDVSCEPADNCPVPAEWITTPGVDHSRIILYLHGGAFYLNYDNPHRNLVSHIGREAQMRALLLDFRLPPEHPYPAAVEDIQTVYQWLLREGYSPKNLAIAGDSSGGGLALTTVLKLRDTSKSLPAAIVCICPWVDLTGSGESTIGKDKVDFINIPEYMKRNAKNYAGNHNLENPHVSPLFANLTDFPPLMIQAATRDILLDDAIRLAERARHSNVDVTLDIWIDMIHVFQMGVGFVPESNQAIRKIGVFLREHVGTPESSN